MLGGAGTHATTASYFFSQKRFGRNTEAMAETTLANELAETSLRAGSLTDCGRCAACSLAMVHSMTGCTEAWFKDGCCTHGVLHWWSGDASPKGVKGPEAPTVEEKKQPPAVKSGEDLDDGPQTPPKN